MSRRLTEADGVAEGWYVPNRSYTGKHCECGCGRLAPIAKKTDRALGPAQEGDPVQGRGTVKGCPKPDNWVPVIEKDVDGPNSLPLRLDGEVNNLGKFSACRRVARAIYMGSAPTAAAAHRGLEDRQVKLGCVMPGETPAVFGDALRRLAGAATYLYQDGPRYWYSTQPTVLKLAEDRAEQLIRDPDKVAAELDNRLRADLKQTGEFARVHPMPASSQDVPDDRDARLVVLSIDHTHSKEPDSSAEAAARAILETRGSTPRLYRNALVFLAADRTRMQDLDEATRRYLAWESIRDEKESLELAPQQVKQVEAQMAAASDTVAARLPETFQWLLAPEQATPKDALTWQAIRLSGQEGLAVRASKKLRSDELLLPVFAATRLRMELDNVPLWRGDHVEVRQLIDDYARYPYLSRFTDSSVLVRAITDGVGLLTWETEAFAYADDYDEAAGRYIGLRGDAHVMLDDQATGFLVKPDVARRQMDTEMPPPGGGGESPGGQKPPVPPPNGEPPTPQAPRRFHGTVVLDTARVGRDASRIADEVIVHLAGLVGSTVKVTLEVEAEIPDGVPDNVVRTVTENGRTLRFESQEFEAE
jgi:hypothetical protein